MNTALGWALIHFIWQGTFVAILLAGVLQVLRGRSTNARYAAACAALLLMLIALPVTTAIVMSSAPDNMTYKLPPVSAAQSESQPVAVVTEHAIAPAQTADVKASPLPWSSMWSARLYSLLPWIILLWLLGVIFFALRLFCGWLYTERLKFQGTRPPEEKWEQALRRLRRQLGVTCPVRLLESAIVKVPMVIGWLGPVILLPASALTGLTPQQVEAIIAHELAHIRRHDYLINLLQAVVETLLFYHPAVWWVSRQIRQEREHCCDDLAVAVCGEPLTYARALLEMEQLRATGRRLAVAANGGLLMNRIQRLVGAQPKHVNRFGGLFASVIAVTTLTTAGVSAQILLQSSNRAYREVVSVRERESMKVDTATETPGESKGDDASQQTGSAQEDRAAEALGLLKQSDNESSMGALRKPMGTETGIAPDQRVNQQRAADDLGRLYDEQTEDRLKERVIIALARLDNGQARAKLNEITRSEKQFFLRERAMDELARGLSADELSRLYDAQTEDPLKERVIIALARLDNERARTKLNEIVRSEKRFYLRERALNELAQGLGAGQAQPVVR
jgi:beta-lactamase regulating signal transducer with metallopeptidase domain